MRIMISLITLSVFAFSTGCQANAIDNENPLENITSPVPPHTEDATHMPSPIPTPADAGLQELIEKAKTDLAQRLTISVDEIILMEATAAEWSDSSLDCPQPGMEYLQVITPGYRILLEANSQAYEYHSNRDAYVIYCENSTPPGPLKP